MTHIYVSYYSSNVTIIMHNLSVVKSDNKIYLNDVTGGPLWCRSIRYVTWVFLFINFISYPYKYHKQVGYMQELVVSKVLLHTKVIQKLMAILFQNESNDVSLQTVTMVSCHTADMLLHMWKLSNTVCGVLSWYISDCMFYCTQNINSHPEANAT